MRLSLLLKKTAELEEAVAGLYGWYAQLFEAVPNAGEFFRSMEREEMAHRNKVEFQKRIVDQNPGEFKDCPTDGSDIQVAISLIEQHVQEGVFEIGDALKFAIQLENNNAEIHYRTAMTQSNPDIARLVEALTKDDKDHCEKLRCFAMQFVGKSSTI